MRSFSTIVTLLALSLAACRPPRPPDGAWQPQVALQGVRIEYFQGSRLASFGRAAKLSFQRTQGDFIAYELVMKFPPRESRNRKVPLADQVAFELRSRIASGNVGAQRTEGTDGVMLRSADGLVCTTERALFDAGALTAEGQRPVAVRGPGYQVDAERFFFDMKEERFTFFDEVQSRLGDRP